jgi:uncharacterized phage protein gp47/JayE
MTALLSSAFPLPGPDDLTRQQEAFLETEIQRLRPDLPAGAIARAVRSPRGMLAMIARTQANILFGAHLHLRWVADQLLPDTASLAYLLRHGSVWGVHQRPATRALGIGFVTGLPGTPIPANLQARLPSGALAETWPGGEVIGVGGTVNVSLRAVEAGLDGNAAGAQSLPLVTPLAGLDPQVITLDGAGMQGGADVEATDALLVRLLAVIREPGHGGAGFDYSKWIGNSFAIAKVRTIPNWTGPGSVGVVVAMGNAAAPRAPIPAEIAAMQAHLGEMNSVTGLKPVTAEVTVIAAALLASNLTVAIQPDSLQVRAAAEASWRAFYARDAEIGGRIALSRLSEAISSASGEYRHVITAPAADVVAGPTELPVPGALAFAVMP